MPYDGILYDTGRKKKWWEYAIFAWIWPQNGHMSRAHRDEYLYSGGVECLVLARSAIADPQNWIQKRYETLDGRRCAAGALRFATRSLSLEESDPEVVKARLFLTYIARGQGYCDIESMNDSTSHQHVLNAFDKAIKRAQQARMHIE